MAGSVNKVILVGNLGRDPEVRYTQSNQKIVHLSVATSERWKDRQSGDPRERTEWHRVVIFNEHLAGIAERYLSKGSPVYLEGTLQTRKWTDQGGQEHTTTEVVVPRFRGELTLLGGRCLAHVIRPRSGVLGRLVERGQRLLVLRDPARERLVLLDHVDQVAHLGDQLGE